QVGRPRRSARRQILDERAADHDAGHGIQHVAEAIVGERDHALDAAVRGEGDEVDGHRRGIVPCRVPRGNGSMVMGRRAAGRRGERHRSYSAARTSYLARRHDASAVTRMMTASASRNPFPPTTDWTAPRGASAAAMPRTYSRTLNSWVPLSAPDSSPS